MSTSGEFIGRGWALPVRAGPRDAWRTSLSAAGGVENPRGGMSSVAGADKLEASLHMILGTAPGERVMRPEFGCRLWDMLFAPVDANTLGLMAEAVRDAVGRWEPRVQLEEVSPVPDPADPACVSIRLRYRVKTTNDRRNLVYPFYVIPHEERS